MLIFEGFYTSKGDLIRGILFYPKPMDFKFYRDSLKYILFMAIVGMFGLAYACAILLIKGVRYIYIVYVVAHI